MKSIEKNTRHWFVFAGCVLVTLVIAVICLPPASAETEGVLTYTLDGTEATITKCAADATDEQVAAAFDEICSPGGIRTTTVAAIGNDAFYNCTKLTGIELPVGVTSIGYRAFYGCSVLESVIIPDSTTNIDYGAFEYCTALTSVNIPYSVTSIGKYAFSGCASLSEITVEPANAYFVNDAYGALFDKEQTTIIQYPIGNTRSEYTVLDGVTNIGDYAFSDCTGLTDITIPDGVMIIGIRAFIGCSNLANILIPDSVTSISELAFSGCSGLTEIGLPNSLTSIGDSAFSDCSNLTDIDLPTGLTNIGDFAFSRCTGMTEIIIPAGVTIIGDYAFNDCANLVTISVDEGNTFYSSEGGVLFDKAGTLILYPSLNPQSSYDVPSGVTSIGNSSFSGCIGLTKITLPDSLTSIGNSSFSGCVDLTEITIPDGVTSIGDAAFRNCSGLTEITLPDSLTSIGENAFYFCVGLKSIDIPNGVTGIGYHTFAECIGLESITIPDSVASLGEYAFYKCAKLTELTLPIGLTHIGYNAFTGTSISQVRVPAALATITTASSSLSIGGESFKQTLGPFNDTPFTEIVFDHGMEMLPANVLSISRVSLGGKKDIYIPMSVAYGADEAGLKSSSQFTIHGVKGTYIIDWAEKNDVNYVAVDGEIRKTDIEHAWLNVPYQYIIETGTYENVGLNFNVVGGTLPAGLELLPDGRFHGAPLETGTFTFVVEVRYPVFDYLLDIQSIVLTVEEPVGYPGDIELFESNDYPITDFVGESTATVDGVPVGYVLTAVRDDVNEWIFRVADNDINEDGLIDADDSNFPYFTDFWLDGEKLTSASAISGGDYGASEGSTVVTVYAKTFQNLDNGNHTIAAEFMIPTRENDPPVQKVAAQKFTLELSDPEPVPEEKPDPEPDPDLNTDPDPEPGPDPDPEQKPDPDPNPEPEPEQNEPEPGPDQNTPLPGGISGGWYTATATAQSGTEPNSPAALITPTNTDAADETRVAPAVAPEAAITEAEDTIAAGGDTNPAGTVGASTVDGLPRDENGLFYFVLDGSGAPLEARIDIPLADFADMYFDGELWALGEDYETREGSTVIIIAAEKLAGLAYGLHEIDARFTGDRTVSFAFDLRGPAPASGAEAGPIAPAENTANAALALAAGSGIPAAPFVIAALIVVILIAAACILRARRLRRAG